MTSSRERAQSLGEEIANSVTHGVGLAASIVALPILIVVAMGRGDAWQLAGSITFGVTLVLLYGASTLYHALVAGRAKRVFRVLDHSAIYLLIAGTYTPFMLGALRGPVGWTMLVVIWLLAAFGVVAKCVYQFRYPRLSTVLYVGMGWMIVLALQPLVTHVAPTGLALLIAGGLAYTGGVVFYSTDSRVRYGHAIWHGFVAAGSACHFFAVLWYAGARVG